MSAAAYAAAFLFLKGAAMLNSIMRYKPFDS